MFFQNIKVLYVLLQRTFLIQKGWPCVKEKNVNENQPEKFYAKFVAKPRLSKKDRKQAMIEEIWDEDDEDDWDEDE